MTGVGSANITVRVDDFVFDMVNAFYTPRRIVELIHVTGIYMPFSDKCAAQPVEYRT